MAPSRDDTIVCNGKIFVVSTDKSASATDETKWKAKAASGGTTYAACPTNPTP